MNYQLNFCPDYQVYELTFSGEILPGDLISALKDLWQDKTYCKQKFIVWNFTESRTNYFFEDIFALFQFVLQNKKERGPEVLAVVAPFDNEFGMSRMYAMISESNSPKINVFREILPAKAWLQQESQSIYSDESN